jgi:hypothetical protein
VKTLVSVFKSLTQAGGGSGTAAPAGGAGVATKSLYQKNLKFFK